MLFASSPRPRGERLAGRILMLVLTRKEGEAILVDGPAKIQVVRGGSSTRLAIEAPRETKILRAELALQDKEDDCGEE